MKRLAPPLLSLLTACAEGSPPPALPTPSPSQIEAIRPPDAPRPETQGNNAGSSLFAITLRKVEQVRSLKAKADVRSKTLTRAQMGARVKAHIEADVPEHVRKGQGYLLSGLGLLPPGYDYEAATNTLYEQQLAGYYEPADKTMYLARDLPDSEAEATLAHELVHALQDQHFAIGDKLTYHPDTTEQIAALHALAEGDAMSAMFDFMLAHSGHDALDLPDEEVFSMLKTQVLDAPGTRDIPEVLRSSLIVPYIDGLRFVHHLRRQGGWPAVDQAFRAPPATTEQLLHPDKYAAREPALAVGDPPGDAAGGGFTVYFADAFGEQGMRLAFEALGKAPRAATLAAAGWGGDRATILARTKSDTPEHLVTWRMRFDGDPKQCREADEAHDFVVRALFPKAHADGRSPLCRERTDLGPLVVARSGCDVLISSGPFTAASKSPASRGQCSAMSAWASKVVAQR